MTGSPWRENFDRLFPGGITVRPTLIRGTPLFVDRLAMLRHLHAAHPDLSVEALIDLAVEKEATGEVQVGRPPLGPGEELVTVENGCRWGIISADWPGGN
jgi:hypothetical protein